MMRYLLNISYLGTPFRGLQRIVASKDGTVDQATVQGQIEIALKVLNPMNEYATVTSSRTDAGVHAIHTTMHVDLQRPGGRHYEPTIITTALNQYFVPMTFHCRRNAISRTYLYRLGVVRGTEVNETMLLQHIPIEEYDRSLFICTSTFDVNKVREATELFVGLHDFRTFMHRSTQTPQKRTRRIIEMMEIREAQPLWTNNFWPSCIASSKLDYKLYDIVVKGNGFLYRQVRRTVACLIAVAKGIVTPRDIKFMLEIPSRHSWIPKIKTVPAHGLYLCEVAYSQNDLDTFKEHLDN